MFSVKHKYQRFNLNIALVRAVTLIVAFTFTVASSECYPKPITSSRRHGNQNACVNTLQGEQTIYASSVIARQTRSRCIAWAESSSQCH